MPRTPPGWGAEKFGAGLHFWQHPDVWHCLGKEEERGCSSPPSISQARAFYSCCCLAAGPGTKQYRSTVPFVPAVGLGFQRRWLWKAAGLGEGREGSRAGGWDEEGSFSTCCLLVVMLAFSSLSQGGGLFSVAAGHLFFWAKTVLDFPIQYLNCRRTNIAAETFFFGFAGAFFLLLACSHFSEHTPSLLRRHVMAEKGYR